MEDGKGRKIFPPPPNMLEEIQDILTGELKETQCFGFAGINFFLLERGVRTHLSSFVEPLNLSNNANSSLEIHLLCRVTFPSVKQQIFFLLS